MTTPPNHNTADQSGALISLAKQAGFYVHTRDFNNGAGALTMIMTSNDGRDCINITEKLTEFYRLSQHSQSEPIYWEVRHFDTANQPHTWGEWKKVEPRQHGFTIESRLEEIRDYIASGYKYELRALYATPQPFPAPAVQSGELPELPDPLEIFWPDLHHQALGCGIEDRNLHDRYECAEYGWQNGMERAMECVPDDLYDGDQMREYARQAIAQTAPAVAGEAVTDGDMAMIENAIQHLAEDHMDSAVKAIRRLLTRAAPSQGAKHNG